MCVGYGMFMTLKSALIAQIRSGEGPWLHHLARIERLLLSFTMSYLMTAAYPIGPELFESSSRAGLSCPRVSWWGVVASCSMCTSAAQELRRGEARHADHAECVQPEYMAWTGADQGVQAAAEEAGTVAETALPESGPRLAVTMLT